MNNNTHSKLFGYILWIFGFLGAHRFYYGKPVSGMVYMFTFGLFGIGWIVDLFLIPQMDAEADSKYAEGLLDYNIAWLLLVFAGIFGGHYFYMRNWTKAILYLLTAGFLGIGIIWDYWTLNSQISSINERN